MSEGHIFQNENHQLRLFLSLKTNAPMKGKFAVKPFNINVVVMKTYYSYPQSIMLPIFNVIKMEHLLFLVLSSKYNVQLL